MSSKHTDILYRLQGWLELRPEDAFAGQAHLVEMRQWIAGVLTLEHSAWLQTADALLEKAENENGNSATIVKTLADYLDTIFEHYVTPDYPGNALYLKPAAIAAGEIYVKPAGDPISGVYLAYRLQGYLELSEKSFTRDHLLLVLEWMRQVPEANERISLLKKHMVRYLSEEQDVFNINVQSRQWLNAYFTEVIDSSYAGDQERLYAIHQGSDMKGSLIPCIGTKA